MLGHFRAARTSAATRPTLQHHLDVCKRVPPHVAQGVFYLFPVENLGFHEMTGFGSRIEARSSPWLGRENAG